MASEITFARFPVLRTVDPHATKKVCKVCKVEKDLQTGFNKSQTNPDKRECVCKLCMRERARLRKEEKKKWNIDFI